MKNIVKILLVGGSIYLAYKYIYPYFKNKNVNKPITNDDDDDESGKITFYGLDKKSYVRGYVLPNSINDFTSNNVILILKPDEFLFGEKPRTAIEVTLDKGKNIITHTTIQEPIKQYQADYDEVKNKFALLNRLV